MTWAIYSLLICASLYKKHTEKFLYKRQLSFLYFLATKWGKWKIHQRIINFLEKTYNILVQGLEGNYTQNILNQHSWVDQTLLYKIEVAAHREISRDIVDNIVSEVKIHRLRNNCSWFSPFLNGSCQNKLHLKKAMIFRIGWLPRYGRKSKTFFPKKNQQKGERVSGCVAICWRRKEGICQSS